MLYWRPLLNREYVIFEPCLERSRFTACSLCNSFVFLVSSRSLLFMSDLSLFFYIYPSAISSVFLILPQLPHFLNMPTSYLNCNRKNDHVVLVVMTTCFLYQMLCVCRSRSNFHKYAIVSYCGSVLMALLQIWTQCHCKTFCHKYLTACNYWCTSWFLAVHNILCGKILKICVSVVILSYYLWYILNYILLLLYFRILPFKRCCQLSDSILLTVSLPKPLTCFKESLISLTKLHLYLGYSIHFLRKNDELVSGGIIL